MQTSPRLLRAMADTLSGGPPPLTPRQQQCHDRILAIAPQLLAEFGPHTITFGHLALALRVSPSALRHHFVDIDDLLGHIVITHLQTLIALTDAIPPEAPDHLRQRRAAYLHATRTADGRLTPAQTLLAAARRMLPADLRDRIELLRRRLGESLAGAQAEMALSVMETAVFEPYRIETILAATGRLDAAEFPPPRRAPTLSLAWDESLSAEMITPLPQAVLCATPH